jgi:hypothetical protein
VKVPVTARDGLLQVLTHSSQHRAQVLSWLSAQGVPTPDLDYVVMLVQQRGGSSWSIVRLAPPAAITSPYMAGLGSTRVLMLACVAITVRGWHSDGVGHAVWASLSAQQACCMWR